MRYVGLVRNVMLGREGLHRYVLLRLVDAAGGRSAASHLTTGNLTFDVAPSRPSRSTGGRSPSRACPCGGATRSRGGAPRRGTRGGTRARGESVLTSGGPEGLREEGRSGSTRRGTAPGRGVVRRTTVSSDHLDRRD